MSMNCPNCAEPLGERGYFCKLCASQARCMKCREVLEPGAAACVECGTRIGQPIDGANGTATQAHSEAAPIPVNRNTLSYQEDRNSRKFEASLTDSAIHGLGDVFGELFAQRGVGRTIPPGGARTFVKDIVIDETKQLPPSAPTEPEQSQSTPAPPAPRADPEKERILKIFNQEGEVLELAENRLKAKSAADYYKRLTYLFIYAQEILLGRSSAPKTELVDVLKASKVYDPNCRFWLKQKKGFTVDTEDRMKLIAGAKEQAIKTLDEALDNNVADEWNPDTRTVKARGSRKKKS
jgi:hypothetical protein